LAGFRAPVADAESGVPPRDWQGANCLDSAFVAVLQLGLRSEVQCLRVIVTMACTECKERNYTTTKNKKNDPNRLELKKYCPTCRRHTLHRETR